MDLLESENKTDIEITELQVKKIEPNDIDFNYGAVKLSLNDALQTYKGIVVTEETLKVCKEKQRELTALKATIETKRKQVKKEYCQPLDIFETKCKELVSLIESVETPLKINIDVFNQKVRDANIDYAKICIGEAVSKLNIFVENHSAFALKPSFSNLSATKKEIYDDIHVQAEAIKKSQTAYQDKVASIISHVGFINNSMNLSIKLNEEDFIRYANQDTDVIQLINNKAAEIKKQEELIRESAEKKAAVKEFFNRDSSFSPSHLSSTTPKNVELEEALFKEIAKIEDAVEVIDDNEIPEIGRPPQITRDEILFSIVEKYFDNSDRYEAVKRDDLYRELLQFMRGEK